MASAIGLWPIRFSPAAYVLAVLRAYGGLCFRPVPVGFNLSLLTGLMLNSGGVLSASEKPPAMARIAGGDSAKAQAVSAQA